MRAQQCVVVCTLWALTAFGHDRVADATPVSKPAFLVHPDDGYIYRPEDAAFIDSTHLLLTYSRGDNSSGSIVGAGQFFRVYDTANDAFTGEVDLNGIAESAFHPIAVAGRNGRGRIAYLSPRNGTNSLENDLWLLAVGTDGNLVGQPVRVSPFNTYVAAADVALLEDGTALVVWWTGATPTDPRRLRIYGRRFTADLSPLGADFPISDSKDVTDSDHIPAAFPRVDAGSYFNVVFESVSQTSDTNHVIVASLNPDGTERWRATTPGTIASVATLANDSLYLAYSAEGRFNDQEDTFATLVSPDGTLGTPYRLPIPRRGSQRLPEVAVHKGAFAVVAYGGSRGDALDNGDGVDLDSVDLVNLDFTGAPLDADPPLIDNNRLGTLEAVGNQRVVVAASSGDAIALLYNAEQVGPNGPAIGKRAKMMLLRAGAPDCPLADQSQCDPLVPFHITGSASHRINVVIRPSGYPGPEGRVDFLRQLRDHVITETYFGTSQHQSRTDRFNFLYELKDAQIPMMNYSFICPEPIDQTDFALYQTRFPWVRAVGAQLDPTLYYDSLLQQTKPPMTSCATPDFANGGGSFFYPAFAIGTMEHEMSHALYHEPDEYKGGGFLKDNNPIKSQYLTLSDCQADATASGWNPGDCYLACDTTVYPSCGMNWYSAEPRQPAFPDVATCNQWLTDHNLLFSDYPCAPNGNTGWYIPKLVDLMDTPDNRTPGGIFRDSNGQYLPANDVTSFRTVGFPLPEPAPRFQRACERRALYVLDNAALTTSANTTPTPRILVMATVDHTVLRATSAAVLSAELGPTWDDFGALSVTGLDSDNNLLSQAFKTDPRLQVIEGAGTVFAPDGKPVAFQVPIVAGLRRVHVSEPTQTLSATDLDQGEHVLLDVDLGPTLVSACARGEISPDLCATFDSDGDGCNDVVDPEPLVPETEPPVLTASVYPVQLMPRNHKLQDVTVTTTAHDNCTPHPRVVLESITSSEPESVHPGDPSPDIADAAIGTDDTNFQLRAETYASSGRIYTIVYSATDKVGNTTRATVTVEVPHDAR